MLNAPFDLRRTGRVVGAIVRRLALVAHKRCAAFGTSFDKLHGSPAFGGICRRNVCHAHYLGNNFARFFYAHHVANVEVELTDDVFVMQRGAAHGGAGQQHGLHIRHRRDSTRAPHLECHVEQARHGLLGLKLIGNGPARIFRRVAQPLLLSQVVHFEHNAVGGKGQGVACLVPIVYIVVDVLQRMRQLCRGRNVEAPARRLLHALIVGLGGEPVTQ